nr:hypothetical protein [uncultured Rhodopila sp.]
MTPAERQRRHRLKMSAGAPAIRYKQPADRRTKPQMWADAVQTLGWLLEHYEHWHEHAPSGSWNTATADRLEDLLALKPHLAKLAAAKLPSGYGRDGEPEKPDTGPQWTAEREQLPEGLRWFAGLSEAERKEWAEYAGSEDPAELWAAYRGEVQARAAPDAHSWWSMLTVNQRDFWAAAAKTADVIAIWAFFRAALLRAG